MVNEGNKLLKVVEQSKQNADNASSQRHFPQAKKSVRKPTAEAGNLKILLLHRTESSWDFVFTWFLQAFLAIF